MADDRTVTFAIPEWKRVRECLRKRGCSTYLLDAFLTARKGDEHLPLTLDYSQWITMYGKLLDCRSALARILHNKLLVKTEAPKPAKISPAVLKIAQEENRIMDKEGLE